LGDIREEVIGHIDNIPGFNATVAKVIQLANDPMYNPKDLIQTIILDPILTAEILKLINSAYFGIPSSITSLNRAVVMLGINTVKNLALSSSLLSSIKMRNNFQWFTSDEFWAHSLGVGVGAKILAGKVGVSRPDREEYFIAGLLHDMGKIIPVQYYPDQYAKVIDPEYKPELSQIEKEVEAFGIGHAELGYLMTKKWELPDILTSSVNSHHKIDFSGDDCDRISAVVHLADSICNSMEIGIKGLGGDLGLPESVLRVLSLTREEVEPIFDDLEQQVEDAKVFLRQ